MLNFNCVVIGAGISGMTASIYLKRSGINVLLIEKNIPGGQINRSSNVENYPGFEQIDGPSLAMNIFEQVQSLNISIEFDTVINIRQQKNKFEITTKNKTIISDGIIVATGREANKLNIEHEEELLGHGISYCAICDGSFYKDKNVGVVGGGNSAMEEALYLSNICKKVTIFVRRDKFKENNKFLTKILKTSNIRVEYNSKVVNLIQENNKLTAIEYVKNDKLENCKLDGLFLFVGNTTNLDFINYLNLNIKNNNIIVDSNMRTNIKKLYACGDVVDKELYQLITAASDGAIAANSFIKDFK